MEEDHGPIKDKSTIPKNWIKQYIFQYIHDEIIEVRDDKNLMQDEKEFWTQNYTKMKSNKEDIRMFIWIGFQRCKVVLKFHEIYLNVEDENNYNVWMNI